ncbi:MAG: hypothetical protein R3C10_24290 [Pirellulales bacterium]
MLHGSSMSQGSYRHGLFWLMAVMAVGWGWPTTASCQTAPDRQLAGTSSTTAARPLAAAPREQESWDIVEMMGAKVGYSRTSSRRVQRDERELIETESLQFIELTRLGQSTSQSIEIRSLETPDGDLVSFQSEVTMGAVPMTTMGVVRDGQLVLTTTTQGTTAEQRLTWPQDAKGLFAAEQLMRQHPLKPGETRTLQVMVPVFNQIGTVELTARDYETTSLYDREVSLLRIEMTTQLPGGVKIDATEWTDRTGEILKTSTPLMKLDTYRVPRRVALGKAASEAPDLDLVLDLIVPVARPIPHPHETAEVTYRVRLERDDPAAVFCSGGSQHVKTVSPHLAEITCARCGRTSNRWTANRPPGPRTENPTASCRATTPASWRSHNRPLAG